jgi:hypothetical protein
VCPVNIIIAHIIPLWLLTKHVVRMVLHDVKVEYSDLIFYSHIKCNSCRQIICLLKKGTLIIYQHLNCSSIFIMLIIHRCITGNG